MIDNFDLILNLLPDTPEEDYQYYCQIIKRKKDHPGLEGKNNSARLVKPYYFTCKAEMIKRKEEMIAIAEATGARIMMDAFPKSRSKVKFEMMIRLAEVIRDGNDAKLQRLYNSVYGAMKPIKGRALWLIDWDDKDTDILDNIIAKFNNLPQEGKDISKCEVAHKIPTRQGWHYLIKPFYLEKMTRMFKEYGVEVPDIHKTSPTLVYIPKSLETKKD